MKKSFSEDLFLSAPIVGILRGFSYNEIRRFLPLYMDAGLRTIEVTMNSPEPANTIQKLVQEFGDSLNVGAGTVCDLETLRLAIDAGASFIVTPNTDEKIIAVVVENGLTAVPGAFTPTEIYKAMQAGAAMIKLFPASAVSPAFVKDIKGPFADIKLVPTGGIGLENMAAFMKAGAYGVGLGSQLFDKKILQGSEEEIRNHFYRFFKGMQHKAE